jgi:type III restriction enzyme
VPSKTIDRVESPAAPISLDEARARIEDAVLAAPVVPARKGQREQLQPILDAFLTGLGPNAQAVLSGYLDRAAAGLIRLITDEHRKFLAAPDYDEIVSWREFNPIRYGRPEVTTDRYGTFRRGVGYEGWKKSLFDQVWFDSSTERNLANVLDETESIELWARLHVKDLEIRYRGGTYNPDFLVAEDGQRWIVETKADRDIATENVQAKRRAAEEWANIVNADAEADARWGYMLVSESDLAQSKEDWPALVQQTAGSI